LLRLCPARGADRAGTEDLQDHPDRLSDHLPHSPPADPASFRSPIERGIRRIAAALLWRDFRILWFGAFTSTIGTWVQKVAQGWLVTTLTGSALYLGFDAFLGEVPFLLFTLIGGVVADRYSRRHLLMGSQVIQMTCAFTLAALVATGVVTIWHILALSFVSGIAQAFGGPAYQSLLPSLVPKQDLPNAVALNSIQFNLARMIGPLIAGVTLAAFGMAICFGLNGLSFLVVICALFMLRVEHTAPVLRLGLLGELRGGLSFVRHQTSLLTLMALAFVTAFLALPLTTFLPIFAQDVLQGGAAQYAQMLSSSGAGAVTGALLVAYLGRFRHMGSTLLSAQALLAMLVIAFCASRSLWVSLVLLFGTGATMMIVMSLTTSLVQLIAPDEKRGRVMSIYMVAFRGGWPLGSLLSGYLISIGSAPVVFAVNAGILLVISAALLVKGHAIRDA